MISSCFFTYTFLLLSTFTTSWAQVGQNSKCGHNVRERVSWELTSVSNRNLFQEALALAYERNLLSYFPKLHMSAMNEMVGHDTCAFTLWHRKLTLVYENLLRDMDPKFACLTIPYFDTPEYVTAMVNGECGDLETCAPMLTELGGGPRSSTSNTTLEETRTVNGRTVTGTCVSGSPFDTFCDDNHDCGCMIRNTQMSHEPVPQSSSYPALFNIVSQKKTYADFSHALQNDFHNAMHYALGGFLSTLASPIDPIFFALHVTVDMLVNVWQDCHVSRRLTMTERQHSTWAFSQMKECRLTTEARETLDPMSSQSQVHMTLEGVLAEEHPVMGKYFRGTGSTYSDLADSRGMGENAYGYRYSPGFDRLLRNPALCPGSAAPTPTSVPLPTPSPTPADGQFWDWYDSAHAKFKHEFPNNPELVQLKLEYIDCVGHQRLFGIQNFTQSFIQEVLKGQQIDSRCQQILDSLNDHVPKELDEEAEGWGTAVNSSISKIPARHKSKEKEKSDESIELDTGTSTPSLRPTLITLTMTVLLSVVGF